MQPPTYSPSFWKIHGEERFGLTEFTHLMIHPFPLLGRWHQLGHSVVSHRHVVKEPGEGSTQLDHLVIECFAAEYAYVLAGVAAGNAKWQTMGFQQLHGCQHFIVGASAAAGIVAFSGAFYTNGRDKDFLPAAYLGRMLHQSTCRW